MTVVAEITSRIAQIQSDIHGLAPEAAPAQSFDSVLATTPAGSPATASEAAQPTSDSATATDTAAGAAGGQGGAAVVSDAQRYIGVPYQWGGTDPSTGLDCSGLVQRVFADLGVSVPRVSQDQAHAGVAVDGLANAQPGDLVFFAGSDGTDAAPGHVGIYIGNGQMIDAPYTGAKVRVDPVGDPVAIRRIVGAGTAQSSGPVTLAAASTPALAQGRPATLGLNGYTQMFVSAGAAHGVPAALLAAVARQESGLNPSAVSPAGAEGLMQLMPSTAASLGVDPWNPSQAVDGAARMLAGAHAQFGSWGLALAAYNAGPGAVTRYGGVPPYPETQNYVTKVLAGAGMSGQ